MIWSDHSREGHYLNQMLHVSSLHFLRKSNVTYIPKQLRSRDFFRKLITAIGLLILWWLFNLYYIEKIIMFPYHA